MGTGREKEEVRSYKVEVVRGAVRPVEAGRRAVDFTERRFAMDLWNSRALWAPFMVVAVALAAACGSGDDAPSSGGPAPTAGPGTERVVETADGTYTKIDPARLESMLASKDFILVNVHVPYEGEIEGTDLFVAYDDPDRLEAELPTDKTAEVVIYCRSGNMSTTAAEELVKRGFTNLLELEGGMVAWVEAGKPIVQSGG
jgi:rhodanese-related sulfurtransferase